LKKKSLEANEESLGLQIVTHFPYGSPVDGTKYVNPKRKAILSPSDLLKMYKRFGTMISVNRNDFGDVFVLTAKGNTDAFITGTKLKWDPVLDFYNQGKKVTLLQWLRDEAVAEVDA
jgi:hypothetical protein